MAFDYSGKSGAPCLMVLVDKIAGGKRKEWCWQLPEGDERKRIPAPEVKTDPHGFTLAYADATLRATFVSPADLKIEAGDEDIKVGDPRHGFHGTIHRVKATGAEENSGEFFVIITVQRKGAPEVKVEGKGLGARVTVGKQAVRFDGRKIVLGE